MSCVKRLVTAVMLCTSSLVPLITLPALADEYTQEEIDIDDTWEGAHVSAKFGIEDAVHDHDGVIPSFSGTPIMFMGNTVADGGMSADVTGSGNGTVHSIAGIYYHPADGGNMGTSSQSLKPFTVQGNGTINTSITIDFDGLMVVDEQSANAADWSQAVVDYHAAIQTFNDEDGAREDVGDNVFNGSANITQNGNGAAPVVNVPQTIVTLDEDDGPDEANDWYNNGNLSVVEVVAAGAGAGQINVGALVGATQVAAQNYLNDGRNVYYLTYSQTFNFDATGGETYYVYMDLFTGVNATDGGFTNDAFAVSDFSNTVSYDLAGGGGIRTSLLFDGDQSVGGNDAFGGATSDVSLEDATLNFTNNATLNENFTLADGTDNTLNTNANTATLAGDVSGGGSLEKTGAGTLILTGNNTYTGGTTILTGTLEAGAADTLPTSGDIIVANGATLDMNNNNQSIGGIGGTGTVDTGGATLTVGGTAAPGNSIGTLTVNGGNYSQANGSFFEAEFNDAGGTDLVDVIGGGTATVGAGATLVPVALDRITATRNYIFMSAAGGIAGDFGTVQDNYAVLDFAIAKINANVDYQLTVSRDTYSSAVSTDSTAANLAGVLDEVFSAGSIPDDMVTLMDELDTMSVEEINEAYESLQPDVTGAAVNSANATTGNIQNIVGQRTEAVRSGQSGGDMLANGAGWTQAFYGQADQDRRGGHEGYESDSRGFAMGADAEVAHNARAGLAYGYGNTNSDNSDTHLEADGHTAMIYGSYEGGDWYADAMASFGWHDYDSRRDTPTGAAEGSYDGQQYAVRVDTGYPLSAAAAGQKVTVTPTATVRYSHLDLDDYQESGAPGANLDVDSQSFDTLTAGMGANVMGQIRKVDSNWSVTPEAHAGVTYDIVQDDVASTARFVAAGPAFETDGLTPARAAVEVGAGLQFSNQGGLDVRVNYEGEFRSDYDGHTGVLRLRQSF